MSSQPIPPERLGERIRRLRESRGLKQHELATRAKVHRNTLRAIEKGRSWPEEQTLAALADVLETSPTVLLDGAAEMEWTDEEMQTRGVVREQGSTYGESPPQQLLDFLSQRLGHRRVAGELTDKDLIAAAYTLARKHGFSAEDYRLLDRWRDQIIKGEKG